MSDMLRNLRNLVRDYRNAEYKHNRAGEYRDEKLSGLKEEFKNQIGKYNGVLYKLHIDNNELRITISKAMPLKFFTKLEEEFFSEETMVKAESGRLIIIIKIGSD